MMYRIVTALCIVLCTTVTSFGQLSGQSIRNLSVLFDGCAVEFDKVKPVIQPHYVEARKWMASRPNASPRLIDFKTNQAITIVLSRINNEKPYGDGDIPGCDQLTDMVLIDEYLEKYISIMISK